MVYFGLRGRPLAVVVSLVAATAFMLQGYDQAVMNSLVTLPTFDSVFPEMAKSKTVEGEYLALAIEAILRSCLITARYHCGHL